MSLKPSSRPSRWHSAWWPRQTARNGCSRSSSRSTTPRITAIFGSSSSRGSPGPGPTITRSAASRTGSSRRGVVLVVTDHAAGQAEHAEHVAQHVDEVVLAVERPRRACRAAAGRAGCRPGRSARSVDSRRLRALSASSTSSSLTSSATFTLGHGCGRYEAEGAEDAARLGVGLGDLVRRVGVAHERRAGRDGEPSVEVDVRRTDHDRAVDDRLAVARRGRGSPARRRSSRGPRSRTA